MRPVELNVPRTCIHFAMQMLPFKQWQCFPKMYHKHSNDAFRLSANQATSSIGFQELGSNSLHGETIARKEKKNSDEDEWCVKYKLTQLFLVSVWVVPFYAGLILQTIKRTTFPLLGPVVITATTSYLPPTFWWHFALSCLAPATTLRAHNLSMIPSCIHHIQ